MKSHFLLIFLLLLGGINTAYATYEPTDSTKKPNRLLHPTDSVLVTVEGGQRYLLHPVKQGQTLYALSKYYGLSITDLYYANPILKDKPITIGFPLKIPISHRAIQRTKGKYFDTYKWRKIEVCYVVKPKDTMFKIAKTYFRMSVDTLKERNGLIGNAVYEGQKLVIGWIDVDGIPKRAKKYTGMSAAVREINQKLEQKFKAETVSKKLNTRRGAASWNKKLNGGSLYAMHRKAKVGSIMRVTNPLNKRVVYVKIIGRLQGAAHSFNIHCTLSPAAAKALGGIDSNFLVQMEYYQ